MGYDLNIDSIADCNDHQVWRNFKGTGEELISLLVRFSWMDD